jgi:hypothetical protein
MLRACLDTAKCFEVRGEPIVTVVRVDTTLEAQPQMVLYQAVGDLLNKAFSDTDYTITSVPCGCFPMRTLLNHFVYIAHSLVYNWADTNQGMSKVRSVAVVAVTCNAFGPHANPVLPT